MRSTEFTIAWKVLNNKQLKTKNTNKIRKSLIDSLHDKIHATEYFHLYYNN